MAKAPKITAPEDKNIGIVMNRRASEMADKLDSVLVPALDALAVHKQEWEGGRFEVMDKMMTRLGELGITIAELPDPKSETGNNPAHYKIEKYKDGKASGWKEVYYYRALTESLPGMRAKGKRIDQLTRSMADATRVYTGDIEDDIKALSPDYREALVKRLNGEITSAIRNVVGAFELMFQLSKFGELKHVSATLVHDIDKDGSIMDGEDGRPFKIDPTTTPIIIASTIKGRELHDRTMMSVGTFLKIDVAKAEEAMGTYQAVMDTLKRHAPPAEGAGQVPGQNAQDQSKPKAVNTFDTFLARATDMHEFADRTWSEKSRATIDALIKATHGEGTDLAFVSCRGLFAFLQDIVGSPVDAVRYQSLINADVGNPQRKTG